MLVIRPRVKALAALRSHCPSSSSSNRYPRVWCPPVALPGVQISWPTYVVRRSLFELHAGRQARPPEPSHVELDEVSPPVSQKNEAWHTTSEDLIRALGPIGEEYASLIQHSTKLDFSYTDAFAAARNYSQARDEADRNAILAKEQGPRRRDLKSSLVEFLDDVERLIPSSGAPVDGQDGEAQFDKALTRFVRYGALPFLEKQSKDISDLMTWAWILKAPLADTAVYRFMEIQKMKMNDLSGTAASIPNVIFLFLLRRRTISAQGVRLLVAHAWYILREASAIMEVGVIKSRPLINAGGGEPSYIRKVVPHVGEHHSGFQEDVFIVMIIRLFRHARRVWPAACESITAICCQYLNGLNFHKQDSGNQNRSRLAFIYNTMLTLLAGPASVRPFIAAVCQQRAQFAILRRMHKFEPPLIVDRRGYRAVTRVQLMHKKTLREREWARLKAPSWPPWKEDQLGIDADIGPEFGLSRAKKALSSAEEAGYASDTWSQAASLLAGWDTDDSPSIQTRAIFDVPRPWAPLTDRDELIWVNRLKATRTLNEAWAIYENYRATHTNKRHSVYNVMLEKIGFEGKRASIEERSTARRFLNTASGLPGDHREVSSPPLNPHDHVYVKAPPPTSSHFIDTMVNDGVRPSGELLATIFSHAPNLEFGIKALLAGGIGKDKVQNLLREPPNAGSKPEIRRVLRNIPAFLFDSFISLLCRHGSSHTLSSHGLLTDRFPDAEISPVLESVPILHAINLVRLRHYDNIKPWIDILNAFAKDNQIMKMQNCGTSGQVRSDILAWNMMITVMEYMEDADIYPNMEAFSKLCVGLDKATLASETLLSHEKGNTLDQDTAEAIAEVLSKGLPFLQQTFKSIVRAEPQQAHIPETIRLEKEDIYREVEEEVNDMSTEASAIPLANETESADELVEIVPLLNDRKKFLPALCLLPRLLEVPTPAQLHVFIRVLGLNREHQGLHDLLDWMSLYYDEIKHVADQKRGGMRMWRRCIIAIRVFLERSWLYYDIPDRGKHVLVQRDAKIEEDLAAPTETWLAIKQIIEEGETRHWGGWPTDEEVKQYISNGRFV